MTRSPVLLGLAGLAGAVVSGIAFMVAHDAPPSGIIANASAMVGAIIAVALAERAGRSGAVGAVGAVAMVAMALALVAIALMGDAIDGIRRWLTIGPLTLHLAMLTVPALVILYARRTPSVLTVAALTTTALALGLQPDRGSAIALLAASIAIFTMRRTRFDLVFIAASLAALFATILRPDPLAGVAFVEHVLADSWAASPIWGLVLLVGTTVMFAPFAAWPYLARHERIAVCGWMAWTAGLFAASLLGEYPTPAIGVGASAIIGHGLALGLLRNKDRSHAQ